MVNHKINFNGFTLLEVIVAIFLILTGLIAILTLINYSLGTAKASEMRVVASFLAQEGIEVVRYTREVNSNWGDWYNSFATGTPVSFLVQYNDQSLIRNFVADAPLILDNNGYYQYDDVSGKITPFYRKVTLTKLGANEVKVLVEVKWKDKTGWKYLLAEDRLWNWK